MRCYRFILAASAALTPFSAYAQDDCSTPCGTEVRLETVDLGTAIDNAQTAYDLAEEAIRRARAAEESGDIEELQGAIDDLKRADKALEEAQDVLGGRVEGNEAAIRAIVLKLDPIATSVEEWTTKIPEMEQQIADLQVIADDFAQLGWYGVIGGGIGVDLGQPVQGILNGATLLGTTDLGLGFQSKSWGVMGKFGYNPHFATGGSLHGELYLYGRVTPWFGIGANLGGSKSTYAQQESGNHLADFAGATIGPQAMITALGDGPLAVDLTLGADIRAGQQWDYIHAANSKVRVTPRAGLQLRLFIDKPPSAYQTVED